MIEFAALSSPVQALSLVVLVSIEAIAFYVGYGALEERLAPPLIETIETV